MTTKYVAGRLHERNPHMDNQGQARYALMQGDCLEELKALPGDSLDSLVTDPPAGISFMGKEWDDDKGGRKQWVAWMTEVMAECLRVMKPGAHGLVWALPRTSHWTATALEDAGFEVRDVVTHLFGTGFPKSMDIEKAITKAGQDGSAFKGFGTALKPASEHWILIRKPCSEKTVAANVLKWGVGGINIDASRVSVGEETLTRPPLSTNKHDGYKRPWNEDPEARARAEAAKAAASDKAQSLGRFPANLVLDEEAAAALDAQSIAGGMHSAGKGRTKVVQSEYEASSFDLSGARQMNRFEDGDKNGASRFFYVAKASKSDKGEGNTHPTVKSTALMSYLIKLVTPLGGVVLDPFTGSGSTGVAALNGGFRFLGVEQCADYFEIARARLTTAEEEGNVHNLSLSSGLSQSTTVG